MQPLISVIVPIYRVEDYIYKCVDSIINQTYKNLEVILVDDGSPDKCPEICDEYALKDNRIKVVHKKNGGLSDARNAGMPYAKGEYIGFVDSDDSLMPNFYECLYNIMAENDADIVECGIVLVDEDGKALRERKCKDKIMVLDKKEALKELILEKEVYQTVWNKLYKKEVINNILFEKGKYHEDDFWTYQVFDNAQKVVITNEVLYKYLQRSQSIMGAGYSVKRFDGFEAHYLRMQFLQKYKDLGELAKENIMFDCLYNFQCAVKYLDEADKKLITDKILEYLKKIPQTNGKMKYVNFKYRAWFKMFRACPFFTAKLRNLLKIGI